jgi:ubiquinone/menaquinone biosynthesis C-methylase UbiE
MGWARHGSGARNQGLLALRPCFQSQCGYMKPSSNSYIPALGNRRLTRFYDPMVRLITREATFKDALLQQANIQDGHRVLDLGCGTGTLALLVKTAHRGAEVRGFDADPEALRLARIKLGAAGIAVQLDQGRASALPYGAASFDRVFSSLFFHHLCLESKLEAMREVLRVLSPGGEFHIADWGKPTGPVMRLAFVWIQLLDGIATTTDHVRGRLPYLIALAGFENVEISRSYSTLLGTMSLYRARKPVGS